MDKIKTPHDYANEIMGLSQEFSLYSGEMAKLKRTRAEFYTLQRANLGSDTALQRAFEITDDGIKMTTLKLKLSAIKVQIAANKTMITLASEEERGLY